MTEREGIIGPIVIIGATGMMGGLIAKELKEKGVELRFLVRPESHSRIPSDLSGIMVYNLAEEAFADTVVFCVQGGKDTILDVQLDYSWLALEFLYANLSNLDPFTPLVNARYPQIKPVGVRQFVKSNLP